MATDPVYLDHAATTPMREEVFEAMKPFFGPRFGNPSSTHRWGREARAALDEARERVGRCLGARPDEICFTSGGTEADNLAILGAWRALKAKGRKVVVTTPIEHKAILGAVHQAAHEGAEERFFSMNAGGVVESASIEELIDEHLLERDAEIGQQLRIAVRADAVLAGEADRAGLDAGVGEVD